ncbi:post-transcriptional regulator [Pseudogracilibacillus auburnensis]|uniref:ComN-like post-transcriptional regulator n=1 Tax=Pseudogracilibacillus auburnensis TaxID=1494959 RepID=A0A2V3VX79_9BACI|nr:post-transcriptional regulator [Pseudogracilibacillus auburnensis]MBO1003416.1 post-transcriptional regulator [Pseudogracilibacillus auburnensis]PXW86597.1 ComN-like post-transcriptional regulator [Pseudogracilibacillus auburnensis]
MEVKSIKEWKAVIYPALKSKQSEFKLIGYSDVTVDEIWRCLESKVWKGNPTKRLHEVIQDIFHLPATTYMNFMTVDALHADEADLMSSIQALTGQNNE